MIVKYESIVLTPEQPQYDGGLWDVEGLQNECIVATCHACVRSDNITAPRLEFMSMIDQPNTTDHGEKLS